MATETIEFQAKGVIGNQTPSDNLIIPNASRITYKWNGGSLNDSYWTRSDERTRLLGSA
jgi:hypothetical protein